MNKRADSYNVGTLENRVEVEIKDAQSSIENLISSLKQLSTALGDTIGTTKNNKLKQELDGSYKTLQALKKTVNLGAMAVGLHKAFNVTKDIAKEYIDMVETNNLFEVSMGKVVNEYGELDNASSQYYLRAMDFQDKMNEKLATNKTELKEYQAMYFNMLKAQNIDLETAYSLSENLTKAGYDIASLYNLDVDDAMKKIQSGLAGQVKSLRDIGIDVSESSLQKVLDNAGIERSVQQLTYAEKEIARYIAIVDQAGQAQGDFAKTFEQPANQIKVFKNQIAELKQVAGSFITSVFGNILVYVNGLIMAIKEVLKYFATLFGYDLSDGGSTNLSASVGAGELADDLDTASGNAKKLKNILMGFDEINNITLPSSGGSGGGGGAGSGGIDEKLLASLKEWDNQMESISGKAQQIRDSILDWLGIGKEAEQGLTNFEKILDVVKLIGVAIGAWKLSSTLTSFLKNMGLFGTGDLAKQKAFQIAFGVTLTLTGITAQWQGTQHLLDGNADIFSVLETLLGTAGGAYGIATLMKNLVKNGNQIPLKNRMEFGVGVMLAIQSIQVALDGIKTDDLGKQVLAGLEAGASAGLMVNALGASGKATIGIAVGVALIATSVELIADEVKWADEFQEKYKKELYGGKTELSVGETIDVASHGIGEGATQALADYTSKITELAGITKISREELKKFEQETQKLASTYKTFLGTLDKKKEANITELGYTRQLSEQLQELLDSNGKVKEGYKARVDFILGELNQSLGMELQRDGEIITKNGEIINSYEQLRDEINKTIDERKRELDMEVAQDLYKESMKTRIEAQNKLNKAIEDQRIAYEEMMKVARERPWDTGSVTVATANYQKASNTVKELRDTIDECTDNITTADQMMTKNMIESTGIITEEMINQNQITTEQLGDIAKNNSDTWKQMYENVDENMKKTMLGMSTTIDNNSPEVIDKWTKLSQGSYDVFEQYMDETATEEMATMLSLLEETQGKTPLIEKAWKNLGKRSYDSYAEDIKKLPAETQGKLLANVLAVNGMDANTKKAFENLSEDGRKAFTKELEKMSPDAKQKITDTINEVNKKNGDMHNAGWQLGDNARSGADEGSESQGGSSQIGNWFVSGFIGAITNGNSSAWSAGWNLVKNAIWGGQRAEDSHSPSKETYKLGNYFTEGYIIGIQNKQDEVVKTAENLVKGALGELEELDMISDMEVFNDGIQVSAKDASVDATTYVDYGAVNGNISAQSNVTVSDNIISGIAEAVSEALANTDINVNVEAKTEEGVIVRKATQGITEYVRQTGELPFPVPV